MKYENYEKVMQISNKIEILEDRAKRAFRICEKLKFGKKTHARIHVGDDNVEFRNIDESLLLMPLNTLRLEALREIKELKAKLEKL